MWIFPRLMYIIRSVAVSFCSSCFMKIYSVTFIYVYVVLGWEFYYCYSFTFRPGDQKGIISGLLMGVLLQT